MSISLQVIYPIGDDTSFDYEYYLNTHMPLVGEHTGPHIPNFTKTQPQMLIGKVVG